MKSTLIDQALDRLRPAANIAYDQQDQVYWVHGADEGPNYCYACAEKVAERERNANLKDAGNICRDGGWGSTEDCCAYCDECGAPLSYSLTEYGAEEELAHYCDHGIGDLPISPRCAYQLAEALEGAGPKQQSMAIRVARKVIYRLPLPA